jgi:hypothetical protein
MPKKKPQPRCRYCNSVVSPTAAIETWNELGIKEYIHESCIANEREGIRLDESPSYGEEDYEDYP